MAKRTESEIRALQVAAIRKRQDEVLALSDTDYERFCDNVAALNTDAVHGLAARVMRESMSHDAGKIDYRYSILQRAEQVAVDRRSSKQLTQLYSKGRLTLEQCHYWAARRPKEVPTVNGVAVWIAATLVDIVD